MQYVWFFCLVTRLRHKRKDRGFISDRMILMTADSLMPKLTSIASNGVRSSHAISTIRDSASTVNGLLFAKSLYL